MEGPRVGGVHTLDTDAVCLRRGTDRWTFKALWVVLIGRAVSKRVQTLHEKTKTDYNTKPRSYM